MKLALLRGILALNTLLPAAALSQTAEPAFSPDEIAAMLDRGTDDGVAFSDQEIAAILDTSASPRKRSLKAGEGTAEPGAKGSGVIPDLQIHFATGSAKVSREAQQQLAALARAMQFPRLQDLRFQIAGHTDARGSNQMNQLLSQRRAAAVVDFLTDAYSIAPNRLEAVGYGEAQLADPANPASGNNRRVEVRVE
jgi:outer membrane protein OmpA-like peptidoglycan-associated protein